jgi:DNA polymerase III delta prime subunit
MRDEFLWVEKYRPKTIEECILPEQTKKTFLDFLDKGEVPNLLLAGPAGCGKTTVPLPTYNSFLERVLRSSVETADLSLPAITRTKSLNPSTVDVLSSSSPLKESKKQISQHAFSNVLTQFWNKKE